MKSQILEIGTLTLSCGLQYFHAPFSALGQGKAQALKTSVALLPIIEFRDCLLLHGFRRRYFVPASRGLALREQDRIEQRKKIQNLRALFRLCGQKKLLSAAREFF